MPSLRNRGNGSWLLTISDGYDSSGEQIRLYRTIKVDPKKTELAQRREAEKQAALIEADYRRNIITAAKKTTIAQLSKDYMEDHIKPRLAPRTIADYERIFEKRINPYFGKKAVQDLTASDINRFFRKIRNEETLSGTYQLKFYQQLHELLEYAKRIGLITINVCELATHPKNDTKEAKYYELEDCHKLLKALNKFKDSKWRCYFLLSIYTGMRPGEQIGLNWDDLQDGTLTVRAGSVQLKGQKCTRTEKPKTKKSVRKIYLPPVVVKALTKWKSEQAQYRLKFKDAWPEPDAIFTNELGYRVRIDRPSKRWKQFLQENDLAKINLYGLRHTNASLMISQKINVRDVSSRLGHAQTSTTLNIYAHAFLEANKKATDAVVNALKQAK